MLWRLRSEWYDSGHFTSTSFNTVLSPHWLSFSNMFYYRSTMMCVVNFNGIKENTGFSNQFKCKLYSWEKFLSVRFFSLWFIRRRTGSFSTLQNDLCQSVIEARWIEWLTRKLKRKNIVFDIWARKSVQFSLIEMEKLFSHLNRIHCTLGPMISFRLLPFLFYFFKLNFSAIFRFLVN